MAFVNQHVPFCLQKCSDSLKLLTFLKSSVLGDCLFRRAGAKIAGLTSRRQYHTRVQFRDGGQDAIKRKSLTNPCWNAVG
jgi:hypothetical protein